MQTNGRTIFSGQYADLRPLGRGEYGRVRLCLCLQTFRLVALKICARAGRRCASSQSQSRPSATLFRRPADAVSSGSTRLLASSAHTPVPHMRHNLSLPQLAERARAPAASPHCDRSLPGGAAAAEAGSLNVSEGSATTRLTTVAASAWYAPVLRPHSLPLGGFSAGASGSAGLPASAAVPSAGGASGSLREIAILRRLDHPNIVRLHAALDDAQADEMVLVLEYVSCGSLAQPRLGPGKCASLPHLFPASAPAPSTLPSPSSALALSADAVVAVQVADVLRGGGARLGARRRAGLGVPHTGRRRAR